MEKWKRAGQRWLLGTQAATQGSGSGDGGSMAGVVAGAGHMGLAATPRRMVFGPKGLCAWLDAHLRNVSCVNWAGKGQRREHVSSFQLRSDVPLNMWRQGGHKEVERNSRYMKEEGRITIGEWLGGKGEMPVRCWIGWLLTQLKVTGQGTGEAWGMQSLTVETLRYGSGGQMCRRKRDLGVTNVHVLVKDRSVFKPGEREWCTCCVVTHFIQ